MQSNDKAKLLKQRVVVSRKWAHPSIDCKITDDEISLSVGLSEFQESLIAAIGPPPFKLTRKGRSRWLAKRIAHCVVEIVDEMKKASIHVV